MPYRNPTYKMLMLVLYSGIGFWLLPFFFTGLQLQVLFNSLVFGIATVILVTWGSSAYYALKGNVIAEHQYILATVAVWFIVWIQRLYAIIFVVMNRPVWLMLSSFPAFMTYMFGVTGILVIMAPAFIKDVNRREYYTQLIVGVVIGMLLAGVSYAVQVN